MRHILIFIFCITTTVLQHYELFAQNSSSPYSTLDLDQVPSGYLMDAAIDYIDIAKYDGASTDTVRRAVFEMLFQMLNDAKVNEYADDFELENIGSCLQDDSAIRMGAALFKYNYILTDALSDGLITYNNGQYYDVYEDGEWLDPYGERYVCMFALGKSKHVGNVVTFHLPVGNVFSNAQIQKLEVKFDQYSDYIQISPQGPCSYTHTYSNRYGKHKITAKITLYNGETFLSQSILEILSPDESTSADFSTEYSDTYQGESVSALVSCKLAPGHSSISKPFIFVEGFNDSSIPLFGNQDFSSLYDNVLYIYKHALIIKDTYDIIYVDWNNPRADIRANAYLLQKIITDINEQKSADAEKNLIIGHSMGGLVTRYALASMERNNVLHDTKYYVSYDSPHLGVNVPVGAQYLLRDIQDYVHNNLSVLSHLVDQFADVLDCTAARQMMYNYITPNLTVDNSIHNEWQSALEKIGFPKGDPGCPIENLSMINGGAHNPTTGYFSLKYTTAPESAWQLWKAQIEMNCDSGAGTVGHIDISEIHNNIFGEHTENSILNSSHISLSQANGHELAEGSYISFTQGRLDSAITYGKGTITPHETKIPFVPSASSLATGDYTQVHYNQKPSSIEDTPFGAYFIPNKALTHSSSSQQQWRWLNDQVKMQFNPPSVLLDGDILQVDGKGTEHIFYWVSSDSNIAEIENTTGKISIIHPGMVTISCHADYLYEGLCHFFKSKAVLAGFPEMKLTRSGSGNSNYTVSATCVDNNLSNVVDSLVNAGILYYQWGIKTGNNSIQWQSPTSASSISLSAPGPDAVSVFMRLRNESGRMGDTNCIQILWPHYNFFDIDPVSVTSNGYIYMMNYQIFGDYPPYPAYMTNKHLAVKLKSTYWDYGLPEPDNILIEGEQLDVSGTYNILIDGISYKVYCFDLTEYSGFSDLILYMQEFSENSQLAGILLPITIRSGTDQLQTIGLPFNYGIPSMPHK